MKQPNPKNENSCKNKDNPENEDNPKNQDNHKSEDVPNNADDPKNENGPPPKKKVLKNEEDIFKRLPYTAMVYVALGYFCLPDKNSEE